MSAACSGARLHQGTYELIAVHAESAYHLPVNMHAMWLLSQIMSPGCSGQAFSYARQLLSVCVPVISGTSSLCCYRYYHRAGPCPNVRNAWHTKHTLNLQYPDLSVLTFCRHIDKCVCCLSLDFYRPQPRRRPVYLPPRRLNTHLNIIRKGRLLVNNTTMTHQCIRKVY